ncbi:hypothetical protein V8G69_05195 [Gaetbulibacter sp. M235]|uniref:hypothetical protein n=1 Tax=Gaetbulibacter sp. M235 TaxID=3126510 RepID=UPI00374F4513
MKKSAVFPFLFALFVLPVFAQNDVALLAEDCLYLGKKVFLEPGNYNFNQLGIQNDKLSSFHIPDGMALQIFDEANFRGHSETFYSSVLCLSSTRWNDKASSIRIFWVHDPDKPGSDVGNNLPPQGNKVIFYRDHKYTGMAKEVSVGDFNMNTLGFLTDNISSIYIPNGSSVNVRDKNGRTQIFTNSISSLSSYGWDNRINSGSITYSSGGDNLPPQGNKIIFYKDAKYSGMSKDFAFGNFNTTSLGFLSGNITSIYIPSKYSVKVYDKYNNTRTFSSSISDLSQIGWNDKIVSGVITGGTSGGTLPPQGNKVILYHNIKYSGTAKDFDGAFTSSSLGNLYENVSSVYIPAGWTLQVRDKFGRFQHFTTSISNLGQYGWDNKITSGTIVKGNSGGQQGGNQGGNWGSVTLYADANYKGKATACREGVTNSLGFGANISSIQLPEGFAITVYQGPNLTGSSTTFTNSVGNLASYFGWNDKISSVYVFRQ